jgi:hypothetical protein
MNFLNVQNENCSKCHFDKLSVDCVTPLTALMSCENMIHFIDIIERIRVRQRNLFCRGTSHNNLVLRILT